LREEVENVTRNRLTFEVVVVEVDEGIVVLLGLSFQVVVNLAYEIVVVDFRGPVKADGQGEDAVASQEMMRENLANLDLGSARHVGVPFPSGTVV